jgi:hypothetical protein
MSIPPQSVTAPTRSPATEVDAVLAWRDADAESRCAYDAWCDAPASAKSEAYFVYIAAADRERAAAEALGRTA